MRKLKDFIKFILFESKWAAASLIVSFIKGQKNKNVLLVPAGDLNGGFGEDVMVAAFADQFKDDTVVSIYTSQLIERPDYLGRYNVRYIGGFKQGRYFDFIKVLLNHSEVYILGADILDAPYGRYNSLDRFRILKLAHRMGLACHTLGFSVSNYIPEFIKKEMLSVSKFTILKLRDAASYSRLSFIPEDRLRLTSDIAFLCPSLEVADQEYESWYKKQKQQQNRIVAVCPNAIQANRMGLDKYISDFGYLINKFEEQKHFSFLFLYHDLRPQCSGKNDENISHLLYNIFKGIAPCFFPSNINNGLQLKSYLQKIDFTIAGRMHFGIAGLSYKKPMYGIDYQDKFEGLLKFFDVNPDYYMVDYNKISSKEKNIEQFTDFLPLFELKIKEKLESVIMLCYKNV